MGSRRQHSGHHFGPSMRKASIRKGPGKLKKKCLKQLKRTQQFYTVSMADRYNDANERGDDNVAKIPQQTKIAVKKTIHTSFEEPNNVKVVSRPNVLRSNKGRISPQENVDKAFFSRNTKEDRPSCVVPNSSMDPPHKNTSKTSVGALRPKYGMGFSVNNVESSSRLYKVEEPRSKNTKMLGPSYSRTHTEKFAPFSFASNCGFCPLVKNIEKSRPSIDRDVSNSTFGISKESYPSTMTHNSRKEDCRMVKEASNSSLALNGKQDMQDIRSNLDINYASLPGKNLSSHRTVKASCIVVDSIDGHKTSISKDGKTDKHKSNRKRDTVQLNKNISLEEGERTVDGNDEQADNYRQTKSKRRNIDEDEGEGDGDRQTRRRRKYVPQDEEDDDECITGKSGADGLTTHKETSNFGSESVKLQHYCSLPIDEPIWSGILKIGGGKFVSLAAHLSTKYCEKVWKLSTSLQPVVEVTKVSRLEAWPKSFDASRPTDNNIALYFLPTKMRDDADLDHLVKEVMENDIVLQAIVGEAEMLIFPSILLPEQHQTFQGKHYLWAAFRRRKDKVSIVEEQQHGKARCAQEKGKQQASHCSVGKEGNGVAELNMDVGLEAPNEAEMQDMEQEQNPKLAQPKESIPTASAPTVDATMSANHGQIHSSLDAPTGALFGFVVRRTPRLEQLIQEMQREGAVMVAMQGEMIGSGLGLGRQ